MILGSDWPQAGAQRAPTMTKAKYLSQGCVGKLDLASSGPFFAWLHPAASTIEPTSPASPSLPGEKIARSRADDGVFRKSLTGLGQGRFHQGDILGRISTGQRTANCGWGNDGSVLYMTADGYLCRIKTQTRGALWSRR